MSSYTWLPSLGTTGSYSGGPNPVYFYVSTTGNDTTGDGSASTPWATISKANDVIEATGVGSTRGAVVSVAPGNYWNTSVEFSPDSSGLSESNPVTYVSTGGPGAARLLGGEVVNPASWVHVSGSIYKTAVSSPVYTMWENGTRGRAARLPKLNPGADFPSSFAPYFTAAGVTDSYTTLQYNPVDFDPSVWTLSDVRLFVWPVFLSNPIAWFTDTGPVSALNTTTKRFTTTNDFKFNAKSGTAGARYFVQGPLELLTEAGEFVVTGGFLYYWARDGAIASQEIVIPTTKRVLSFVGTDASTRVSHITFDGLAIEYSDFDTWYRFAGSNNGQTPPVPYNVYQYQNTEAQNGLVFMENVDNIRFTECHVKNSGYAGFFIRKYAQDCAIRDCWIERLGTSGIYTDGNLPGDGDVLRDNDFGNNIINDWGQLAGDAAAIHLNQTGHCSIAQGEFFRGPRCGLEMTGAGYGSVTGADMYTRANVGYRLLIHHTNQEGGDSGAITFNFYSNDGINSISQTIIRDVQAQPSMLDAPPQAVFCDNSTGDPLLPGSGQSLTDILAEDIQGNQFRTNDSGGHVLTNCSFLANGSINPSFDPSQIDTDNIGVTDLNPYKADAALIGAESP